ncbi:PREDICTED: ubiquitin carboxyl-terminal hydrolase 47 [Ceratosolen solmsi marchali]|uniref:Ubiquitin carboxyl-terminal hydrolase 47 n=1 Tax=Ceratosolen solmsi marchali TaxID=326594 RepID=A0AAJ6VLV4_9HYME|nr:PREDICTED: ubiquitin carboxyl-terminal hydrolase 47 [Ceratosolen solmsi marchali]
MHSFSATKDVYSNCIISTANQECIDNKNSDSSDNFENSRSVESFLYNNAETTEYKYVGLVNQAMTCYLNSLLQALYMTPEFRNAVYSWEYKNLDKNTEDKCIPFQLQKLFLNLQTSSKPAVETTSLTTSFGWNYHDAWDQHDIQELCRVMFDALEQTFKNTKQADLISGLYEGKINDYVKCLTCHTEKSREDTFLDIPLPVKPFDANVAYKCVQDALEAFVKYETLEGNNQYFCEECNQMSDAHKGLKFTKFPYILTLQLKRFDFDQKSFHRIKLNDKVAFPDFLNLNSFIDSKSNQESSSHEDDAGIKGDDSSTTHSTVDEECVLNDVKMSNSNYLNNPNQDDDEGIDMRPGMVSCNAYNYCIQKLRKEYASTKGPYIYELFSIMIHSGSASGGHYYAYIKDFRNKKWQCFNDQNVTPIDSSDIPKIYGGSTRPPFYTGAYRSSTNAYMLMYRQIDLARNVLPLKTEDFPPHIKDLLEKVKGSERVRNYHEEQFNTEVINVNYRYPANGTLQSVTVPVNINYTLAQLTEAVYKKIKFEIKVELNQCRIVSYFTKFCLIDRTYDDNTTLDTIFKDRSKINNLLLDIRYSNNFELCPSEPIITQVFLVDPVKQDLIDFPKYVRAHVNQTIKEYKQELKKYFDIDPNIIQLLCPDIQPKKLEDDFVFEMQYSNCNFNICATEISEAEPVFFKMSEKEYLNNIFTFDLDLVDIDRDEREFLNIPPLIENNEEKHEEHNSSTYHCPIDEISKLNMSSFKKYKCNSTTKGIDLQETSNSEDSSLSDSDRTLVGDVPEDSDFDCEIAGTGIKNEDIEIKKCIKITDIPNSRCVKVSISAGITEDDLRERLQTKLHIPKDCFRIFELGKEESKLFKYNTTFTRGNQYRIHLGRVPNCDERKVDIYILKMASSEPLQKLFTINLKKNIQIDSAKEQILAELKRINGIELRYEQCNFMGICDGKLLSRFYDEQSFHLTCDEICIQEKEINVDKSSLQVFLRRWNRSEMQLDVVQRIIINTDNFNDQLKNNINSRFNISIENLEFSILTVKKNMASENPDLYDWTSDINFKDVDVSNSYILCRDSKQTPKRLTERETNKIHVDKKNLLERGRMGIFTPMTSSPRKEKALKIHVHST